jgi:hypothetical protein
MRLRRMSISRIIAYSLFAAGAATWIVALRYFSGTDPLRRFSSFDRLRMRAVEWNALMVSLSNHEFVGSSFDRLRMKAVL